MEIGHKQTCNFDLCFLFCTGPGDMNDLIGCSTDHRVLNVDCLNLVFGLLLHKGDLTVNLILQVVSRQSVIITGEI